MLKTTMTDLLGIRYPLQCGTMQGLSRPEFVAAVAEAGGLACLPAATFETPENLRAAIEQTRGLTDQPFGVNVSLFPALTPRPPEEMIQAAVDSGTAILETAGRSPEPYREMIRAAGLIHIHKCARLRDAVKVDRMGVDLISVVGTECGGHPSLEGVTSLVLIPRVLESVKAPVIAGGGFGSGRALLAALALGAAGVNMGTRFMATRECPVHESTKQRLVDAPETDSVLVMQSLKNPCRAMRTSWTETILEMEARGAGLEELRPYISGEAGRSGWIQGDIERGILPAGQIMGLIHDIPSVSELIAGMVQEAVQAKNSLDSIFS
ncbi:MAG: nitronate monooxygenase [Desulfohalobiaceae bacterium]|nr:nitronate monooxygenase [Desulfohalobiaceae bacterium]